MLLILCVAVLAVADTTHADCQKARVNNSNGQRACGRNERYNKCGTACPLTCDNYDNPTRTCIERCVRGCECADGYVRNPDGFCVLPQNCPNRCRSDQHYEPCASACPLTCDNYKNPPDVCSQDCQPGCTCNDGLVLTRQGQCVRREQCFDNPPVCPVNSHYDECGTSCPTTCDNRNDPPGVCATVCNPSCQCNDGYIKNRKRQCVMPIMCPANTRASAPAPACPKDQHYEQCASACPLTCDNYKNPPDACSQECQPGCTCNDGLVLTRQGQCVRREQCFDNPPVCPLNSHYDECGTPCPTTCDNRNDPPGGCATVCNPSCQCDDGYIKNRKRQCVMPIMCPANTRASAPAPACPKDQHYEQCASACPLTCDNYKNPPDACSQECQPGCTCNDGLVLTRQGQCVRREQCFDNPPVCPLNSHYDECGTPCPTTCDNRNDPPGGCATVCNPSCQCDDGYIKNRKRQCVMPIMCPANTRASAPAPACPKDQHYEQCASACPLTCDNYKNPPDACSQECQPGCTCNDGLVLTRQGQCVRREQCFDNPPVCPLNSHYDECGTPCPTTCDNRNDPPGGCATVCNPSCQCDDGYIKNRKRQCVMPIMCPANTRASAPAPACPKDQHYEQCASACPLTCDNYKNPPDACSQECQPGCTCNDGLVLTRQGQCVRREQCFDNPPVCPLNSHYDECGTPCPTTCDNRNDPPGGCATVCNPSCQCDDGYIKNRKRQCVMPIMCPANTRASAPAPACPKDQHYEQCASACPLTCDNYKNPPDACSQECQPGCTCNGGLVLTRQGQCVRREQCFDNPPVCPMNSHYDECGTSCPTTCDNRNDPPGGCATVCNPSCQCDDGYIKNRKRQCVMPIMCPANTRASAPAPACPKNQHYESCATSCPLRCDNYKNPPQACSASCLPGCTCNNGFVLDGRGECVPTEQCPTNPPDNCPMNEVPSNCVSPCNNCKDRGNCGVYKCYNGCDCRQGYYRNARRKCIPERFCPQ